jgi:hypothetical protein
MTIRPQPVTPDSGGLQNEKPKNAREKDLARPLLLAREFRLMRDYARMEKIIHERREKMPRVNGSKAASGPGDQNSPVNR